METVRLKNGAEMEISLAAALMDALRRVWRDYPVAMLELLSLYADPTHVLYGSTRAILTEHALLQTDGTLHVSVRDLLASALVGEGLDMQLGWPFADAPAGGLR